MRGGRRIAHKRRIRQDKRGGRVKGKEEEEVGDKMYLMREGKT